MAKKGFGKFLIFRFFAYLCIVKNCLGEIGSAVMAGIAISLGCIAYLTVGGVIGAVMFSFGLLTVVHYGVGLYTGTCGFVSLFPRDIALLKKGWTKIACVIIGNIVGCLLTAFLASLGGLELSTTVGALVASRLALSPLEIIVRAIGCGFIMTTAVTFAREGKYLPLLFGVPLFICCGFLHSIADSFYYMFAAFTNEAVTVSMWIVPLIWTYIGNYIGCNAYKAFIK